MKYIAANRPELGVCAIYLFDRIDALPEQCHDILDCRGKRNHLFERKHASQKQEFELDTVGQEAYMQFARSLAPLRVEEKGAAALPRSVTFLQGYHISLPSELPLQRNWSDGQPEKAWLFRSVFVPAVFLSCLIYTKKARTAWLGRWHDRFWQIRDGTVVDFVDGDSLCT